MNTTTQKALITLVKDFSAVHTATSLAQQLKMSRWGMWKIVKRLQEEEILSIKSTGKGKTSTQTIHINWNNPFAEKTIIWALAQEASNYKRWSFNFSELEKEADFLLLYGSILHSPKTAEDIDILTVTKEKKLSKINQRIFAIQKTQEKKIHAHNFTAKEFAQELQKTNKIFIDALKKGIVLFGQEKFVEFVKEFCQ